MATSNEQAMAMLQALLPIPGALQFITIYHRCGTDAVRSRFPGHAERLYKVPMLATSDAAFDQARTEACDAYKYPITDPRHNELQQVVRIEGPDDKGRIKAFSAEGSYCEGYPVDVLARLQEAAAAGPVDEE